MAECIISRLDQARDTPTLASQPPPESFGATNRAGICEVEVMMMMMSVRVVVSAVAVPNTGLDIRCPGIPPRRVPDNVGLGGRWGDGRRRC